MTGAEIRAGARGLMLENAPKIFYISIIFVIIDTVVTELQFRLPGTVPAYYLFLEQLQAGALPDIGIFISYLRPPGLALASVLWLFGGVVRVGFMSYCLKISRGQAGEYKDIIDAFAFFMKVILIQIITTVLVFLWSLLFFFPGIAAAYRYRKAYYILLDDPNKSALQCVRESKRIMHGNKLDLFLLDLSFFGWFFLNVLVVVLIPSPFMLPFIMIWLSAYVGVSRATFYDIVLGKLAV